MKKLLAILLSLVLTLGLAACGGGGGSSSTVSDPNCGVYEAESAEMSGVTVDVDDVFEDGFSLELKDGGKAVFRYEGKEYNLKWSLNGTDFEAKSSGVTLTGTLSDGVLELSDVMGTGLSITLVDHTKVSASPSPAETSPAETSPAASPADTGKAESSDSGKSSESSGSGGSLNAPIASPSEPAAGDGVSVTNGLGAEITSIYISSPSSQNWGGRVNSDTIPAGGSAVLDGSVLTEGAGTYDVAAVDENGRNYDVYGVDLSAGDSLLFTADGDVATVTVNGEAVYTGEAYAPDEGAILVSNGLSAEIHSLYVTSQDNESWGDRVNSEHIPSGGSITLDGSVLTEGDGVYDVAAVDENNMNYDVYGVKLKAGDFILISADGEIASVTVNGEDVYTGSAYIPEE